MNNETALTIFNFEDQEIRTVLDERGEPWWVASDVCRALSIKNVNHAVNGNPSREEEGLDEDERGYYIVTTPGGPQEMLCVNESGLYELIFKSRKPKAKAFKRWLKQEVLPSILRTGKYVVPGMSEFEIQSQIAALTDRVERLEEQLAELLAPSASSRRRLLMTPEHEKEVVYRIVAHVWETYDRAMTANTLATSYVKRLSTRQAQRLLEELAREGRLEHFETPHTVFYGGKFKPARQLSIVS